MLKIRFEILYWWVLILCIGGILLGIALIILPGTGPIDFYDSGMLAPFWPDGPPQQAIAQYRFAMGLVGVAIIGWSVTLTFITVGPFRRRELWAWWSFTGGVFAWIATETILCIAWGVTTELIFLGCATIGIGLPLMLSKTWFNSANAEK